MITLRKFFLYVWLCTPFIGISQQVGINTETPDSSAVLDVESIDKGILFPRMTTAQRDAISNPANGLHIFNTEMQCLEYYDGQINDWNCYCLECRLKVIVITDDECGIDFFTTYTNSFTVPQKYLVIIPDSVLIRGCLSGGNALDFSGLPEGCEVKVKNYGAIVGGGGDGGDGGSYSYCFSPDNMDPTDGMNGGHAIVSANGIEISIDNYGLIGGGGGGGAGGGGSGTCFIYVGGGGGGGAGAPQGNGGFERFEYLAVSDECSCYGHQSDAGTSGSYVSDPEAPNYGGTGGDGFIFTGDCSSNGSDPGALGGVGGSLGVPRQPGTECSNIWSEGGLPGKAISGGINNTIVNIEDGVVYGVID